MPREYLPEWRDNPLAKKVADLERQVRALMGHNPLATATLDDEDGNRRINFGQLPDGGYGLEIDGGTVRAMDVATIFEQTTNVQLGAPAVLLDATITPPPWALSTLVVATASIRVYNTAGSSIDIEFWARTNSFGHGIIQGGATGMTVSAGQVGSITSTVAGEVESGSDPFEVEAVGSGAGSSNDVAISAMALFIR